MRRVVVWMIGLGVLLAGPPNVWAVGEAATTFQIYVPPNADYSFRRVMLVVTALSDLTSVNIVDDDADGDDDDSALGVQLSAGQSYVVRIADGAVNDDMGGGAKHDGDYFRINATLPVLVQMATNSGWQHDWVPAASHGSIGERFLIYSPPLTSDGDLDLFAYQDETVVEVYDVTVSPTTSSGPTAVDLSAGALLLRATLQTGEDLNAVHGVGLDLLDGGHTYMVLASKPVTALYGALGADHYSYNTQARDGGGFVPASNGSAAGDLFYFRIPHDRGRQGEKELRVVAYDSTEVVLDGWSADSGAWTEIDRATLQALQHLDYTGYGSGLFRDADLYRLRATSGTRVTAFEANWLETGSYGTSDFASFTSAGDGVGVGTRFLTYLGPPGRETQVPGLGDYFTHVYLYTAETAGATAVITDADSGGTLFSRTVQIASGGYADVRLTRSEFDALRHPDQGIRPYLDIQSDGLIAALSTNWNDNFMTYAVSVDPPEPALEIAAPGVAFCGQPLGVTLTARHGGWVGTIQDVVVTFEVPPGLAYASSSGSLGAPGAVETDPGTGRTRISWPSFVLAPGGSASQSVTLSTPCLDASGHPLPSATLAGLGLAAVGQVGGRSLGSRTSRSLSLESTARTQIQSLSATASSHRVDLAFTTGPEHDSLGFRVTRAGSVDAQPVALQSDLIPSLGDSGVGFSYTFTDNDVSNCTPYYYRVEAVNTAGQVVMTAGPVLAAPCPEVGGLAQTGVVDHDFLGAGVSFPDPGGSGPGGDVATGAGLSPSGSDFVKLVLYYDADLDSLYVGADTFGVAGDADGDGDPDHTSAALAAQGGQDRPGFSQDEAFLFVIDVDGDSRPDYVAGTPPGGGLDAFRLATYRPGMPLTLALFAFDQPVSGSAAVLSRAPDGVGPDLEFVITHFSDLLGSTSATASFRFWSYIGSLSDGPVGEDTLPEAGLSAPVQVGSLTGVLNPSMGLLAHSGEFAAFGNLFSGAPEFDFIPLGLERNGQVVREAPYAPGQPAYTSPIYFGSDAAVVLEGFAQAQEFSCPPHGTGAPHGHNVKGAAPDCRVELRSELKHAGDRPEIRERLRFDLPELDAEGVPLDNVALQSFRLLETTCTYHVTATQKDPLGDRYGSRWVGTSGGVVELSEQDVPVVVARLDFSQFDPSCGELVPVYSYRPEDYLTDYTPPGSGTLDDGFFTYSLLSADQYLADHEDKDDFKVQLIPSPLDLPAGQWVVNVYYFTWANRVDTRVEITLEPGADCPQNGGGHGH